MGAGKDPLQRQTAQNSGQFEQEGEIKKSMAPPAQLFADPDGGGGGGGGTAPNGGGATAEGGEGGDMLPATTPELLEQVAEIVGEGGQTEVAGQQGADTLQAETDPPNSLVPVNDRAPNLVSDAIVTELDTAVNLVLSLTGIDIGTGFGDTTRNLSQGTRKVGADNFSWHKSGRAVDFNQGLRWLIMKDPSGDNMYFRLYLLANDTGAASEYATTLAETDRANIHHNGIGSAAIGSPLVDVTAILNANGFERIPAHAGWEDSYNKREWWHYVKLDGLTWYEALRQIYTEAQIVTAMQNLIPTDTLSTRHGTGGRLGRREGFPPSTLKAIWGDTAISRGKLNLFFSVGSERNCANIPEDVAAARAAMISVGIADAPDIATMISAYQASTGNASPDGYMTVGGGTHRTLGAAMP